MPPLFSLYISFSTDVLVAIKRVDDPAMHWKVGDILVVGCNVMEHSTFSKSVNELVSDVVNHRKGQGKSMETSCPVS